MEIIEEIEKVYGIKIEQIQKSDTSCGYPIKDNKDLNIINSHKFEIKETENICNNLIITIKCKICTMEADIIKNTIHCFYDEKSENHKYASCFQITMEKACF